MGARRADDGRGEPPRVPPDGARRAPALRRPAGDRVRLARGVRRHGPRRVVRRRPRAGRLPDDALAAREAARERRRRAPGLRPRAERGRVRARTAVDLGRPRHARVRRSRPRRLPGRRRAGAVGDRREGAPSSRLAAARVLARHRRRRAAPPVHGELLALGPVGDPLRRGRARDPRARRLDLALVGAGRVVLVEAGPRLLDPGDLHGRARRPLRARRDAPRARRARRAPGVGRPRPHLPAQRPRRVPPLQGGVEGVRQAGRLPRRGRPSHDDGLVVARAPDDDRHAVRRRHHERDGAHAPRPLHARGRGGPAPRGHGRQNGLAPLDVAPGLRRHPRVRDSPDSLPRLAQPHAGAPRSGAAPAARSLRRVPERVGAGQLRAAGQRGLHPGGGGDDPLRTFARTWPASSRG